MEFTSKADEEVKLSVEVNDSDEMVLCIVSSRYPHSQYFVLKNEDIPSLYNKVKDRYIAFAAYLGSLGREC